MKLLIFRAFLPLSLILCVSFTAYAADLENEGVSAERDITVEEAASEPQNGDNSLLTPAEPSQTSHYITNSGTIKELSDATLNRILPAGDFEETYLTTYDSALIYSLNSFERVSAGSLKKGQTVTAFYSVLTPKALSFPPMLNPEVIVIHDSENLAFAKVDYFDEDFVSSDGQLKLNVGEEVLVVGQDNSVRNFNEAAGKNLLVFYDITTRSIPAQTSPVKIVILDSAVIDIPNAVVPVPLPLPEEVIPNPAPEEITEEPVDETAPAELSPVDVISMLSEEDFVGLNGDRYVPLYKVAEILGYELEWDSSTGQITMRKPGTAASYTITNGNIEYGFNKALFRFNAVPFIKDGRTYVEEGFIEGLNRE